MALFKSKEEKQVKKEEKLEKKLAKYGLNGYVDTNDTEESNMLNMLFASHAGDGAMMAGNVLPTNEKRLLQGIFFQNRTIIEQNKVMIHFLAKIAKQGEPQELKIKIKENNNE